MPSSWTPCTWTSNQVLFWLGELRSAINNPYIVFEKQIIEAHSNLCDRELTALINNLKSGLEKAQERFLKWMDCWIHLPLTICLLGGSNGPDFARSICYVFLDWLLNVKPTEKELQYTELLKKDKLEGNIQSFGLFNALRDPQFLDQFLIFSISSSQDLSKFPLVYDFVKYRIWSIIVHQQQLEGMFNKYDIKTHPNMTDELQEARLLLSSPSKPEVRLVREDLMAVWKEQRSNTTKKTEEKLGEVAAKDILKELSKKKL